MLIKTPVPIVKITALYAKVAVLVESSLLTNMARHLKTTVYV